MPPIPSSARIRQGWGGGRGNCEDASSRGASASCAGRDRPHRKRCRLSAPGHAQVVPPPIREDTNTFLLFPEGASREGTRSCSPRNRKPGGNGVPSEVSAWGDAAAAATSYGGIGVAEAAVKPGRLAVSLSGDVFGVSTPGGGGSCLVATADEVLGAREAAGDTEIASQRPSRIVQETHFSRDVDLAHGSVLSSPDVVGSCDSILNGNVSGIPVHRNSRQCAPSAPSCQERGSEASRVEGASPPAICLGSTTKAASPVSSMSARYRWSPRSTAVPCEGWKGPRQVGIAGSDGGVGIIAGRRKRIPGTLTRRLWLAAALVTIDGLGTAAGQAEGGQPAWQLFRHSLGFPKPSPRAGHSVELWNSDLLVYGGRGSARDLDDVITNSTIGEAGVPMLGDLWKLDLAGAAAESRTSNGTFNGTVIFGEGAWERLYPLEGIEQEDIEGEGVPQERTSAATAVAWDFHSLLVFGGLVSDSAEGGSDEDRDAVSNDELWHFDLVDLRWSKMPAWADGAGPSARHGAAAVYYEGFFLVMGGRDEEQVFGELWSYSLFDQTWTLFDSRDEAKVYEHAAAITYSREDLSTATPGNLVVLYGGMGTEALDGVTSRAGAYDVFQSAAGGSGQSHTEGGDWFNVNWTPEIFRAGHSMVSDSRGLVWVYGGAYEEDGSQQLSDRVLAAAVTADNSWPIDHRMLSPATSSLEQHRHDSGQLERLSAEEGGFQERMHSLRRRHGRMLADDNGDGWREYMPAPYLSPDGESSDESAATKPGRLFDHGAVLWEGVMIIYGGSKSLSYAEDGLGFSGDLWALHVEGVDEATQLPHAFIDTSASSSPAMSPLHMALAVVVVASGLCMFMAVMRKRGQARFEDDVGQSGLADPRDWQFSRHRWDRARDQQDSQGEPTDQEVASIIISAQHSTGRSRGLTAAEISRLPLIQYPWPSTQEAGPQDGPLAPVEVCGSSDDLVAFSTPGPSEGTVVSKAKAAQQRPLSFSRIVTPSSTMHTPSTAVRRVPPRDAPSPSPVLSRRLRSRLRLRSIGAIPRHITAVVAADENRPPRHTDRPLSMPVGQRGGASAEVEVGVDDGDTGDTAVAVAVAVPAAAGNPNVGVPPNTLEREVHRDDCERGRQPAGGAREESPVVAAVSTSANGAEGGRHPSVDVKRSRSPVGSGTRQVENGASAAGSLPAEGVLGADNGHGDTTGVIDAGRDTIDVVGAPVLETPRDAASGGREQQRTLPSPVPRAVEGLAMEGQEFGAAFAGDPRNIGNAFGGDGDNRPVGLTSAESSVEVARVAAVASAATTATDGPATGGVTVTDAGIRNAPLMNPTGDARGSLRHPVNEDPPTSQDSTTAAENTVATERVAAIEAAEIAAAIEAAAADAAADAADLAAADAADAAALARGQLGSWREVESGRSSDQTCAICLMEYQGGSLLRIIIPCGHMFHTRCVDEWLRSHDICPICKVKAFVEPDNLAVPSPFPIPTTTFSGAVDPNQNNRDRHQPSTGGPWLQLRDWLTQGTITSSRSRGSSVHEASRNLFGFHHRRTHSDGLTEGNFWEEAEIAGFPIPTEVDDRRRRQNARAGAPTLRQMVFGTPTSRGANNVDDGRGGGQHEGGGIRRAGRHLRRGTRRRASSTRERRGPLPRISETSSSFSSGSSLRIPAYLSALFSSSSRPRWLSEPPATATAGSGVTSPRRSFQSGSEDRYERDLYSRFGVAFADPSGAYISGNSSRTGSRNGSRNGSLRASDFPASRNESRIASRSNSRNGSWRAGDFSGENGGLDGQSFAPSWLGRRSSGPLGSTGIRVEDDESIRGARNPLYGRVEGT